MHAITSFHSVCRTVGVGLVALVATVGCGVDKQTAPSFIGPAEQALALSLSASPDILPRDGSSRSVITLTARDDRGGPVGGRRFLVSVSPAFGAVSQGEVVTGANGQATFEFVAPQAGENVTESVIGVTPFGDYFGSNPGRTVRVGLIGPDIPVAAFTFTPTAPARFESVTFDASGSVDGGGGSGCASCTFSWAFGAEATAAGRAVQYRFQNEGIHQVRLTVTGGNGMSQSITKTVTVGRPVAPTAAFTFSPTNPEVGDAVHFNASTSTAANGASIVEYRWDFGNGDVRASASPEISTTYAVDRTYSVQLTVVDSNGLTATVQRSVAIAEP